MNKELKARWIEALRGGAYPQGRGHLQMRGKYCCLGVLREIAPARFREVPEGENNFLRVGSFGTYFVLSQDEQNGFARMNDAGVPFEMIAGLIDEAL